MDLKIIHELLKEDIQKVNDLIKDSLKSNVELLNTINGYLFEEKGKQLRPLLSLITAKACGATINQTDVASINKGDVASIIKGDVASINKGDVASIDQTDVASINLSGVVIKKTYLCAAVVEMIHTATLLHDDVADNAPKRRGAETVQSKFSPASSVLTGDYWLAKSLSLLVKEGDSTLMGFFTNAVEDLSEGELFQMQKSMSLDTTEEDYLHIISRKTSSLFIAAIAGAAYCSGASQGTIDQMKNYAYHLGIAFQIRDDIFDYTPEMKTGKNAGTDIKEKKITLPLICALNSCTSIERENMLNFIKSSHNQEEPLVSKTFNFVKQYSGVTYAQEVLAKHSKMAIASLNNLTESQFKKELANIAMYVGTRQE